MGNYNTVEGEYKFKKLEHQIPFNPNFHSISHLIYCSECGNPIFGERFKCINCKDKNYCVECEKKEIVKDGHDSSTHVLLKSHFELKEEKELNKLIFQKDLLIEEQINNKNGYHKKIICDGCETVCNTKVRYSCLNCEFDLCEHCEAKIKIHSLKIKDKFHYHPLIKSPKCKNFKFIPRLDKGISLLKNENQVAELFGKGKKCQDDMTDSLKINTLKNIKEIDYKVRLMHQEDLDKIIEIEKQSFTFPYDKEHFAMNIEASKKGLDIFPFVVTVNGEIAGYVLGRKKFDWFDSLKEKLYPSYYFSKETDSLKKTFYAHGISLAISPIYRRKGIGKVLMKEMIKKAVSLGCKRITLNVSIFNKQAQKLYSLNGFQTISWRSDFFKQGSDNINFFISDKKGDAITMCLFIDKELENRLKKGNS